jgi:hypothetical protein
MKYTRRTVLLYYGHEKWSLEGSEAPDSCPFCGCQTLIPMESAAEMLRKSEADLEKRVDQRDVHHIREPSSGRRWVCLLSLWKSILPRPP